MEYNYAFLILLLPFLSFLVLGLVGMKMKRPVAALIGTVLMGCVFAMSVYTAYEYFFAVGRDASTGMYPTVTVFNFTWLKFTELQHWFPLDTNLCIDAHRDYHRQLHGSHLQLRLYGRA